MSLIFGQLVIGPPFSGKTTYCNVMSKFLESLGRKVAVINLDSANENMEYKPAVDIRELIKNESIMNQYKLGPNGSQLYCMEYMEININWLIAKLLNLKDHYLLFDCPGQIELYLHHKSIRNIVEKLGQNSIKLCSVHLIESHQCNNAGKYLSALLVCTQVMLHIGLPHINLMSKFDQMKTFSKDLPFNIEFYTEVLDLKYLLDQLDNDLPAKHKKLNAAIISTIESQNLVNFIPLDIFNKALLLRIKNAIDKANGYIFGQNEPQDVQTLLASAIGATNEIERMPSLDEYTK